MNLRTLYIILICILLSVIPAWAQTPGTGLLSGLLLLFLLLPLLFLLLVWILIRFFKKKKNIYTGILFLLLASISCVLYFMAKNEYEQLNSSHQKRMNKFYESRKIKKDTLK